METSQRSMRPFSPCPRGRPPLWTLNSDGYWKHLIEHSKMVSPSCRNVGIDPVLTEFIAGIPAEKVAGTETSVFAASMGTDFMNIVSKDADTAPVNTATGTTASFLASRLSWYFDLKGPSMQVNTACSTSMIAIDLACQSLRSNQCSMVSTMFPPKVGAAGTVY